MTAGSSTSGRGDGFLSLRLERALDMDLRRQIGMRDWLLAVVVVSASQITGVNALSAGAFSALLATSIAALATWQWVFPRLPVRRALWLEVAMITITCFAALALVAVSGGPDSPYVFFYAVIIVFIAAFVERAAVRTALIALACLCALAPIAYDWQESTSSDFLATIVLAVAIWIVSAALIALKRSSAVSAELEARRLAYMDPLTGAGTRRALDEYSAGLASLDVPYAVVRVRAEGIDEINLAGGHLAGDAALRRIADAMRAASLDVDQIARLGGVDFAVLLPAGDLKSAGRWRSRFHERLELANAQADDGLRVAASSAVAATGELAQLLAAAEPERAPDQALHETVIDSSVSAAERARHMHDQLERVSSGRSRPAIESVNAPASVLLSVPLSVALGFAIAATGGATSVLLSASILLVTYFATFGTRMETLIATISGFAAVLTAVISQAPVSDSDQMRTLTILVTIVVLADTVQRNARTLTIAERKAADLSLVDPQTGLGNRTAFERELVRMIPRSADASPSREQRLQGVPAVIAIDFGAAGPERRTSELELVEVASGLRDAIASDGTVYRIGSDDFAVVFRAHHEQHVADVIAHCEHAIGAYEPNRSTPVSALLGLRYGGALWSPGMSAADMASAAVRSQPPADSQSGLELAIS